MAPSTLPGRVPAAVAGVVSAAVALGVGELVAAQFDEVPSLVVAVGDTVIDRGPRWFVRFGIDVFGQNDKDALVVGIIVFCVVFGAALGVASRRRRWVGPLGFAAFGVVGALAAERSPLVSAGQAAVVAAVATVAGAGALLGLLAAATPRSAGRPEGADAPAAVADSASRRAFLVTAAALTALAAATAVIGRTMTDKAAAVASRLAVVLPRPRRALPPPPADASFDVPRLAPVVTPNDRFYRIDTEIRAPAYEAEGWTVEFTGMVDHPFEITYQELLELPMVEEYVTLACVSNEVGGYLVGNAAWLGVPLADLLDRAGVQSRADQIVGSARDGFSVGFPVEAAYDGRHALVAVGMNGEPLPHDHGFPVRLVVAGLYGYVSATKWLSKVELTRFDEYEAYWVPRGWSAKAPVKTQSRIDVPESHRGVAAGRRAIAGVAWAPTRGIDKVEVQVDDGAWRDAQLAAPLSTSTWRQWMLPWIAEPGTHRIRVRATDGDGVTQTDEESSVMPDGATGWHTVEIEVTEGA